MVTSCTRTQVGDHMTPCPDTVAIDAPLVEARRFMQRRHIRHLPVVDENRLSGLLTDRDIKLMLGPDFDYPPPAELKVRDAYAENAYIVDETAPLDEVATYMAKHHIGSALVTRHGDLCGIFTATDAFRVLAIILRETEAADFTTG